MELIKTVVCKLKCSKEEYNKLMDTLRAFRDACNYISEIAWEKRCFNPVALHHFTYYDVKEKFKLTANLAIRARDRVAKSYKTNRKKLHKFQKLSMDLDKRVFRLLRNGDFRASISTIYGRVKVKLDIGDYQRELLKNPVRDAKLVFRRDNKKLYLHISVLINAPEPKGNEPVGVDIGINNIIYASNGFKVNGKPIEHRRQHFRELRRSLQKRGTSSAKRKLKQLSGRERRWITTMLHQISKAFVNTLKEGQYVVMEKLDGIRDSTKHRKGYNATFHSWAFNRLQQMIEYKCLERGIPVVYIDPTNTSRRCPRCGAIDRRNRNGNRFRCVNCGFQHNADYVASVNLSELARRGWAVVNQPNVGVDDCLHETTYKPPISMGGS